MNSPDISLLVFAALVFAGGILETILHQRKRRRDAAWLGAAARAEGVVSRTKLRESYSTVSDRHKVTEIRVVKFRAPNGAEYEFDAITNVGGIGSKVTVAFNPSLPSDAREIPPETSHHYRGGCGLILMTIASALAVKAWFF